MKRRCAWSNIQTRLWRRLMQDSYWYWGCLSLVLKEPKNNEQRTSSTLDVLSGGKYAPWSLVGGDVLMWFHLTWCKNVTSMPRLTITHRTSNELNSGKGLEVNSRCLITFSIGKNYRDKLWYDIIAMDACHILLGRSWLFDRKVIHDGFLNTYYFYMDAKKITLTLWNLFTSTKVSHKKAMSIRSSFPLLLNHYLKLLAFSLELLRSGFSLPLMSPKALPQAIP